MNVPSSGTHESSLANLHVTVTGIGILPIAISYRYRHEHIFLVGLNGNLSLLKRY